MVNVKTVWPSINTNVNDDKKVEGQGSQPQQRSEQGYHPAAQLSLPSQRFPQRDPRFVVL